MNAKTKLLIFFAIFLIAGTKISSGIELLTYSNEWVGDVGFSISNQTIFLAPEKRIVAYLDNLNLVSGKTYMIFVEYEWKGANAHQPHDFLIDLYLKSGWNDPKFNFIPLNNLRRNGKHKYEAVFNCLDVPDPVSMRIIKLSKAGIQINKFKIETVSKNYLRMHLLSKTICKNKIEICLGIWFAFQIILLFWVAKFRLSKKVKFDNATIIKFKQKKKQYILFLIFGLIIICSIAGSLKLRYNFLLSKNVSLNLLKQKWQSVEMQGEDDVSKNVSISKAPENMNGFYWIDMAINIPISSTQKDEEFIVDFFGENYDFASSKIHIPISNESQGHLEKKSLLHFENAPSNFYIMVYSTYNSDVELKKLALKKRPSWKQLLLFWRNWD